MGQYAAGLSDLAYQHGVSPEKMFETADAMGKGQGKKGKGKGSLKDQIAGRAKEIIPPAAVVIMEIELVHIIGKSGYGYYAWDFLKNQPIGQAISIALLCWLCRVILRWSTRKDLNLVEALEAEENIKVFLEVQVGDAEVGRVEILLFKKHYPKTVDNFRTLCTGEKPDRFRRGKPPVKLSYKGTPFHRIVPGSICQGGDIVNGDGKGVECIYSEPFADEKKFGWIQHSEPGLLSMASRSRNRNGCQFFITLAPAHHLNGRHVVFGQVVKGFEFVREMEKVGTKSGKPSKKVAIVGCGELTEPKPTGSAELVVASSAEVAASSAELVASSAELEASLAELEVS
eukprot:gnl/TRDRNA2_/TRDRNA2_81937_c1_seq1.p1 gnl/TRDRNA2_/TRDRNA2_81937_c1~~gnl/TRDRNA2_/TRDRNA2_81937_c1_seq1.p1  ORF type:complete len:343 (+),score=65.79 gnl/TRDRNA2_/TRDRNA2_81937_c1_seq1:2-1030(+)